jgi:hypothetical protein
MPNKPLPQFVAAMAAASAKEPFDSPDWIFEPKLDGYRAISAKNPRENSVSSAKVGVRSSLCGMDGRRQLRQTTFLGWRDDKNPEEVVLEV